MSDKCDCAGDVLSEQDVAKIMATINAKTAAQRKICADAGAAIAALDLESAELVARFHAGK